MRSFKLPYLQPYKGKETRYDCPQCKSKNTFTRYLDGETHQPINPKVGKCNRESSCGYHYPPRQFYIDNPDQVTPIISKPQYRPPKQIDPVMAIGEIPFDYVTKAEGLNSHFINFLQTWLPEEDVLRVASVYKLGVGKGREVIYWQIDINGIVRTGKIMKYDPNTGKRIKHKAGSINWVHAKLKQDGVLPLDFNLKQCFFGEHLLKTNLAATVAIVESEKTAIIASCLMPNCIWLATGALHGITVDKCRVLKGRNVILYPDLRAFDEWKVKANEIEKYVPCKLLVSELLENEATVNDRQNGFDIADLLIRQFSNKEKIEIQSCDNKSSVAANGDLPLTQQHQTLEERQFCEVVIYASSCPCLIQWVSLILPVADFYPCVGCGSIKGIKTHLQSCIKYEKYDDIYHWKVLFERKAFDLSN